MLFKKTHLLSQIRPTIIQGSSYNFFSKNAFEPKYDNSVHDELLHDKKFLPFLKTLNTLPLEIGKDFHSTKKHISMFSESAYLSVMAAKQFMQWEEIFKTFYKSLADKNVDKIKGTTEKNLRDRVTKFFRDIAGTGLSLEIIEPAEPFYKVHIVQHRTYKGVFIDRMLNLHISNYYHKKSGKTDTYEKIPDQITNRSTPTQKIDWSSLLDKDLNQDYIEKDRKGYTINQYVLEIETNAKMVLVKKEGSENRPIYGRLGDGYESHYIVIENRREYFEQSHISL